MSDDDQTPGEKPYKVGPGCPPLHSRWKPGCPSPNPHGAPRKAKPDLFATLDPLAAALVAFDEEIMIKNKLEGSFGIKRGRAALEKLYKDAMTEKKHAAMRDYQKITAIAREKKAKWEQEMLGYAFEHREQWLKRFEHNEAMRMPLPNIYPDPRDIEIHDDHSVEIHGPTNAKERAEQGERVKLRNKMLSAYRNIDTELPVATPAEREQAARSLKRRIAKFNATLPPRLRKQTGPRR